MRYLYITLLTVLLGGIAAQAQTTDYQPLVREGVVWHYARVFLDMPNEEESTMFFEGDSVVNEIVYKKCITVSSDGSRQVVALMREQDKVVYSIGGANYAVESCEGLYNGEIILYDFSNPKSMFRDDWSIEWEVTAIDIDGVPHNCYTNDNGNNKIIEGIGLDGSGTLTDLYFDILTSTHYLYTGLSYVERDGKIIYKGSAYETPPYQPLVREGVVWHYAYYVFVNEQVGGYTKELKVQFKGDTIISGEAYKKCFLYEGDNLPSYPVYYAREIDGKVMFTTPCHEALDTLDGIAVGYFGIPGELYADNGEIVVYDFGDMATFISNSNAWDDGEIGISSISEISSISMTEVDGKSAKSYHIRSLNCYDCDFVEGVGADGTHSGLLFAPLVFMKTCVCSAPAGLIELTDLEGNVLYKGQRYDDFYSGVATPLDDRRELAVRQEGDILSFAAADDGMANLIDADGRVVATTMVAAGEASMPVAGLSTGVYILQLSTAQGTSTAKVVLH